MQGLRRSLCVALSVLGVALPLVAAPALGQTPPPAPVVQEPISHGDPAATVTGIEPDATIVILYVEGQPAGFAIPGGADTVDVTTPFLINGLTVTATQETPGGVSAASDPVVVQPGTPPPPPVVQGPIAHGDPSATVTGVEPDATLVILFVEGQPAGFTIPGGADTVEVTTPFLLNGLAVTATQETPGGGTSAASDPVVVQPGTPPPPPVVQGPIVHGDPSATVTGIEPDATLVILFVGGQPAGFTIPGGADTVDVTTPFLMSGLSVTATQETPGGGTSAASDPVVVQAAVADLTFTIEDTLSSIVFSADILGDTDSDSSAVTGTIGATLDPGSTPFSTIQVTDINALLLEAMHFELSILFGTAVLDLTNAGLLLGEGDGVSPPYGTVGPPAGVDALGDFTQTGNAFEGTGTAVGSAPIIGEFDLNLRDLGTFAADLPGTVTSDGSTVTLTVEIVGIEIPVDVDPLGPIGTVFVDGVIVATAPVGP